MRLIDVDAVLDGLAHKLGIRSLDYLTKQEETIVGWFKNAPTIDAEPVVRCKECKFSKPWYRDKSRCFLWYEEGIDVFDDGFCSYGRKDDAEQEGEHE